MPRKQYDAIAQRRLSLWRSALTGDGLDGSVIQARLALVESWRADPWAYLTGKDTDGRPIIWTTDERDDLSPHKPFPNLPYLQFLTYELWNNRITFIDKVRQMIVTTLCSCLADWYMTFFQDREVFVSRVKEESAVKLLKDKIREVHDRKPLWLQKMFPISKEPKNIITYLRTNSTVTGVAQNFGLTDARGSTASLILVDEAAFQDYFPDIYRAVLPMSVRLWAVSTANVGSPGAQLFRALIQEGRPGLPEPEVPDMDKEQEATQ